ncbi:hypothetical protein [Amycolatopsis sp. NPDC051128]|uniref:hypothetical protein n=1 Tax=Amycolatopsis sp. NPDC051128 TaxID=3155412 RepID=UPI0034310552
MFVGRTLLLGLIDDLTKSHGAGGRPRPVLVLEGCGGSGRTAVLAEALRNWRDRTPSVLVQPLILGEEDRASIGPVLASLMLGLSVGVPGYAVAFRRSLIAQIVLTEDFEGISPDEARARLRTVLNGYQKRPALRDFLNALATSALDSAHVQVPGLPSLAPRLALHLVDGFLSRLQRWRGLLKFTWGDAPQWFGHQDQDFTGDHEETLIQLSTRARSTNPATRRGVDDLLVGALLADLRRSHSRVRGRPPNVLVLLDDGDVPAAATFVRSLLRVRPAIAASRATPHNRLPDPLTVVTTSTGSLAEALRRQAPPATWTGAAPGNGPWLRVPVGDLSHDEVRQLARSHDWGSPEQTGAAAYRLTRGHPAATMFVLRRLGASEEYLEDLDALLDSREPDEGIPVEEFLLRIFVRGLDPHQPADATLVDALITLSAARSRQEAGDLAGLLPPPLELGSALYTSPTLWSADGGGAERLHPLARYLGLRALAARPAAQTGWDGVFGTLRAKVEPDDRARRLHHDRMLGGRTKVAAELAGLLPELTATSWLELFDAVVATPDPRERDMAVIKGLGHPPTPPGHTHVLLGVVPALEQDPCVSRSADIDALRKLAWYGFLKLAEMDGVRDRQPFIDRAMRYSQDGSWFW